MNESRLLRCASSSAFLAADAPLRRLPRRPHLPRPQAFFDRFEDRALFYDCFWHADGDRVLLVGPSPMNLEPQFAAASFLALPEGRPLAPRYHASLSTMVTELEGVPAGTVAIAATLAGQSFELPVQPSHAADFAGRRVIFTMSKDNDLAWIAEWARWHVRVQGADAVVFFDNGSSRYGTDEIEQTLLGVDGLARVAVLSWPYRYGMTDPALRVNPFYILFLQVSSMSVALRRFAAAAAGLLNCDVDELVSTPAATTVFALCRQSRHGLVVMRGRYVEPVPDRSAPEGVLTHRHFTHHHADAQRARSRQKKWALDPARAWVQNLSVHPYMHWIEGRPWFSKATPPGVFYRHFRGISTNWKDERTAHRHSHDAELVQDADFAALVAANAF